MNFLMDFFGISGTWLDFYTLVDRRNARRYPMPILDGIIAREVPAIERLFDPCLARDFTEHALAFSEFFSKRALKRRWEGTGGAILPRGL
jgi:hypothetical protein